jgi:hypothetical protein
MDMDLLTQNMESCILFQWRWKYLEPHCEVDPSWEMGRETCEHNNIKGLVNNPKSQNPLIFQKLVWGSNEKRRSN